MLSGANVSPRWVSSTDLSGLRCSNMHLKALIAADAADSTEQFKVHLLSYADEASGSRPSWQALLLVTSSCTNQLQLGLISLEARLLKLKIKGPAPSHNHCTRW